MSQVNVHDAKSRLSKLMHAVESGNEPEIILARNGRPAVRIVPLADAKPVVRQPIRFGIAKGLFDVPESIDRDNADIEKLFHGDGS
jgi:prevent-host-death family protein